MSSFGAHVVILAFRLACENFPVYINSQVMSSPDRLLVHIVHSRGSANWNNPKKINLPMVLSTRRGLKPANLDLGSNLLATVPRQLTTL